MATEQIAAKPFFDAPRRREWYSGRYGHISYFDAELRPNGVHYNQMAKTKNGQNASRWCEHKLPKTCFRALKDECDFGHTQQEVDMMKQIEAKADDEDKAEADADDAEADEAKVIKVNKAAKPKITCKYDKDGRCFNYADATHTAKFMHPSMDTAAIKAAKAPKAVKIVKAAKAPKVVDEPEANEAVSIKTIPVTQAAQLFQLAYSLSQMMPLIQAQNQAQN